MAGRYDFDFESLSDRLQATFKKLRGHGKLTEDDVNEAMREVRMALLEADVNFKVVKQFIKTVKERAIGQDILETLTPAQVVIKIVDEELTKLMGGTQSRLNISPKPPTVIMMVGLQGAGKTTSAGKLGLALKKQGKRPLLVAADIYRPAAITQLQVLGKQLDIPVFSMEQGTDAVTIAKESIGYSQSHACDVVIIDTAGRLQIDEKLMQELRDIKSEVHPHEILLVVDAMTGQESVNVAQAFNDALGLDGVVMTKLDGDARGGAALSVKAVTGVPIKFIGLGEKLERSSRSIRTAWPRASSAWAMCSRSSRRHRRLSTWKKPRRWRRSCARTSSRSMISSRRCSRSRNLARSTTS